MWERAVFFLNDHVSIPDGNELCAENLATGRLCHAGALSPNTIKR